MSKIVQVINAMITNKNKITNVIQNKTEYFFLYNDKFKWSINLYEDNFNLYFYPDTVFSISELAFQTNWEQSQFVVYSTKEIKTQESWESFKELYQVVSEKVYGLDDIFDEIING